MSAVSAIGGTLSDHRDALAAGRSGLTPVGDDVPFDSWFGATYDPPDAQLGSLDCRQARLVWQVLDGIRADVQRAVATWGGDRVAMLVGSTTGGIGHTEAWFPRWMAERQIPSNERFHATHLMQSAVEAAAADLGVLGPVMVQSTACASSLKVFGLAQRLMQLGVVDAVIVGGIDSRCLFTLLGFHGLGIMSPERCEPLAVGRRGVNLGEGGAALLLEREGAARAWVRGVGETSDAYHATHPRPDGGGLQRAMRSALASAGVEPGQVGFINAHATGTEQNDAAESAAIQSVLGHGSWVSATKAYTGHTLGACGALEAVFTALALEEQWLPPLLSRGPYVRDLRVPTKKQAIDTRFALTTGAAFGGQNAAMLLEAP